MAYKTIRPTGLSVKRHNNYFTISWKITDKDYGEGQTLQYRFPKGKWKNVVIGNATTKKTLMFPATDYYPYKKKTLGKLFVRVRGRRKDFKRDTNSSTTINPEMSDWTQKDYDVLVPMRPSLSASLSSSANNVTTFAWKTVTDAESARWFSRVECQTRLVKDSTIVDGSKLSATGWTHHSFGGANGSATITEDSSVINKGVPYTRWFRVRSQGPQGHSEWVYARHVYAVPYQTKNVKATAKQTEAGGYLCTATWKTPKNSAHPVDKINIQYCYAQPVDGMQCPDGISWTDAETLAYKDGSDASSISIDSTVGTDQCMFVRVNTVHDRNTTYGYPVIAAVGALASPTGLTIEDIDTSTYRVTVKATNASQVQDSFLAIKYMTADDPNGFIIGIIPHGQNTITVQCPAFTSSTALRFSAMAVVGIYAATVRGDGVSSYAIETEMRSALVEYGGSVPAAPANVRLSQTNTVGTVRVTFDWAWQQATSAELSWADHEDAWESTDGPETYLLANTHASAWNIAGLETGKTWYIRVRLASGVGENQTFGAYSEIASIDLSSAPAIPILTLSDSVITEDGSVTASWAFSSTDGSAQASAEVAEVADGTYTTLAVVDSVQHVSISAEDAGWSSGETHSLVVRVVSESGRQSAGWSDPVSVTVAEPITAEITQISLVEQTLTEDGVQRTVMSLTEMPLTVTVEGAGLGGGDGDAGDLILSGSLRGGGGAVGIGDHLDLDVGGVHQVTAGDVPDRAGGRTAHGDLTRVILAVGDEAGHVGDVVVLRPLGVDRDGGGVGVHAAQGDVVLIGVLGHVLRQIGGELPCDHAEGVAVRIGIGNGLMADDAAGAGEVVNREGDAQLLLEGSAEGAQAVVRAAAGAPGADHGDALVGIVGKSGGGEADYHDDCQKDCEQFLHLVFSFFSVFRNRQIPCSL